MVNAYAVYTGAYTTNRRIRQIQITRSSVRVSYDNNDQAAAVLLKISIAVSVLRHDNIIMVYYTVY